MGLGEQVEERVARKFYFIPVAESGGKLTVWGADVSQKRRDDAAKAAAAEAAGAEAEAADEAADEATDEAGEAATETPAEGE